jgi:hypothetical protein
MFSFLTYMTLSQFFRKKSTSPPTYGGWNTPPSNLWKWIFYSLNFLKQDKSPLKLFWKIILNHRKIIKLENPIVLDSKWVHLHNEQRIWYVLKYSILYVHCVELLIWSLTQFDFSFYDFSVIYYDFSKQLQGVICPVLESSGGKKSSFIGWGRCVPTRIGGGWSRLFHFFPIGHYRHLLLHHHTTVRKWWDPPIVIFTVQPLVHTSLPPSLTRGTVGVLDRQPTTGSTRSRWMWLTEIGNSKEETCGTQFRQVRAARCVIPYVLYAA